MKSHNHSSLLKLLVVLIFFAGACNKDDNETPSQKTYDFSYSGNQWIGEEISFESNAAATNQFTWIFDDSIKSNDIKPTIRFYDAGAHNVKLIINNDTSNFVDKSITIMVGMERFTGNHLWKGVIKKFYPPVTDTTYALNDSTFSIVSNADSTISVYGITLSYNGRLQGNLHWMYDNEFILFASPEFPGHEEAWLKYYHKGNSLIFYKRSGGIVNHTKINYYSKR